MRSVFIVLALAAATFAPSGLAEEARPYQVLKTARVGGEGGWDYIFADAASRRLYIPRGATRAVEATENTPAVPAALARLMVYNLDTLAPVGEVSGVGGNGTAVDPKHQGRDIGKCLKATMVERILAELPKARFIRTENAGTNAPMLGINVKMGFAPAWQETIWQMPLAAARRFAARSA